MDPDTTFPVSQSLEQGLLGAMLKQPDLIEELGDLGDVWMRREHVHLYRLLQRMASRGLPVDVLTVGEEIVTDDGDSGGARYGGFKYLHNLPSMCPSTQVAEHYAARLRDMASRRHWMEASDRWREAVAAGEPGAMDAANRELEQAASSVCSDQRVVSMEGVSLGVVEAIVDRKQRGGVGISTGLAALDEALVGLEPSKLYVIGGRPGHGKSAIAATIAVHVAKQGHPVAVCSLEMSRSELTERWLSAESGVDAHLLRTGQVHQYHIATLSEASRTLDRLPIGVDDRPGQTVGDVVAHARAVRRRFGALGLVVIDHLHIMAYPKALREDQQIALVTRDLKGLAKRLEVPVLLLAQLNRGGADEGKEPHMTNLRGSGAIEQDADAVLLVYNPGAVDRDHPQAGKLALLNAKQRAGRAVGRIELAWDGAHVTVGDLLAGGRDPWE